MERGEVYFEDHEAICNIQIDKVSSKHSTPTSPKNFLCPQSRKEDNTQHELSQDESPVEVSPFNCGFPSLQHEAETLHLTSVLPCVKEEEDTGQVEFSQNVSLSLNSSTRNLFLDSKHEMTNEQTRTVLEETSHWRKSLIGNCCNGRLKVCIV